jgi:hypothetical protein
LVGKSGKYLLDDKGIPSWTLYDVTSYDIDSNGIFHKVSNKDSVSVLQGNEAEDAYTIMVNSAKRDRDINNKD